jgi:DNA-binding IclR family transcriptional regulator
MIRENGRASRIEMKKKTATRGYRAPALEKGLEILEHLADANTPLSRTEIAKGLGRAPAELFRMLNCLEQRGYVLRDADSGKYRLSMRLYAMGSQADPARLLRDAARQPMEELAETTGQSCHLSVRHGDHLLILMEWLPPKKICLAVGVGTSLPLSRTSSGKLILSGLGQDELEAFLARDDYFQSAKSRAQAAFKRELEEIRKNGSITAPSSITSGVIDCAMPVGIPGTITSAVIAVSQVCPNDADAVDCTAAIRRAADIINRNMGIMGNVQG